VITSDVGIAPPGFRLPPDTKVGVVRLQIGDLQRSIDYYQEVLGLRLLTRAADRAALAAHGDDRPLVWLHERSGVRPVPRRGRFGLYHFAVLLPDRAELGRFVAHLRRIGERAGSADHLVSEALYLTDPDGLGIEVYADRPRSAWRFADREILMTVDPLDIENLIRAGEARPWQGVPRGSTIGHVHLHVGDLNLAGAFYHDALGFDKMAWNFPGALFLSAGGYHHHLGTNTWAPGPAAADDEARLLEWELVLPDGDHAAAAVRSLRTSGHQVNETREGATAADPWGTPLRIVDGIGGDEGHADGDDRGNGIGGDGANGNAIPPSRHSSVPISSVPVC
jgi:catechol 2,3-dioxygenase